MRPWEINIGLYVGILIGIRSYDLEDVISHVLYLPFINIALTIDKYDETESKTPEKTLCTPRVQKEINDDRTRICLCLWKVFLCKAPIAGGPLL